VPLRTCPSMRARSLSGPCRGVPACSLSPQASMGVRQARERRRVRGARRVRPASARRITGRFCSRGARTQVRMDHARLRVWSSKHVLPQRAMVLALREECVTCLRESKASRSASAVIRAGDVWEWAASGRTARTSISWVRSDRPRSCQSSIIRCWRGVMALPPVRKGARVERDRRESPSGCIASPSGAMLIG